MSSSKGEIGSTLTRGIQDIAAILPLLGTEQCTVQVSSALTRGYLYAAATSIASMCGHHPSANFSKGFKNHIQVQYRCPN